jgi:hypothetical protein
MDYLYRFLPSKISKTIKTQNIDVDNYETLMENAKKLVTKVLEISK